MPSRSASFLKKRASPCSCMCSAQPRSAHLRPSAPTPRGSQETRAAIVNGREGNVEVAKGGRERGGEMSDNNERRERARAVACKRLPWSPRLVAAIVTDIRRGVSRVRVELQMNVRWSSRHPLPPLSQNRRTQDGWGGGGGREFVLRVQQLSFGPRSLNPPPAAASAPRSFLLSNFIMSLNCKSAAEGPGRNAF